MYQVGYTKLFFRTGQVNWIFCLYILEEDTILYMFFEFFWILKIETKAYLITIFLVMFLVA